MELFKVNGKQYQAVELDMYFLSFLNKHGIDPNILEGLAATACYLAYCSGMSEKEANDEISQHVIANNGAMPIELFESYRQALEDSGFFRALAEKGKESEQKAEEKDETTTEETPKKKRTTKSVSE